MPRPSSRGSDDIADYPNPDLAIEVDISRPQVDHAGIYAALRVPEVWRFDGRELVIERLTAEGTYVAVQTSGFPSRSRPRTCGRWVVDEDSSNHTARARRLRAELRKKRQDPAGGSGMPGRPQAAEPGTRQ